MSETNKNLTSENKRFRTRNKEIKTNWDNCLKQNNDLK